MCHSNLYENRIKQQNSIIDVELQYILCHRDKKHLNILKIVFFSFFVFSSRCFKLCEYKDTKLCIQVVLNCFKASCTWQSCMHGPCMMAHRVSFYPAMWCFWAALSVHNMTCGRWYMPWFIQKLWENLVTVWSGAKIPQHSLLIECLHIV